MLLQLLFSRFTLPVCEGKAVPQTHPHCRVASVIDEHVYIFCLKLEQPMLRPFLKESFICAGASVLNVQLPLFEAAGLFIRWSG